MFSVVFWVYSHKKVWVVLTCIPKPYRIVGYDPLIRGSDPYNSRFLDPQEGLGLSEDSQANP